MKLDILLPTSLSEIPLSRYQKFIEMKEQSNDEEFIANKMIQIFCGIELKEVMQIKVKELNGLIKHFTDVFSEKPQLVRQFKIKNIEFGFIPDFQNISFGEYVDLEHHFQNWSTYHKAMAVMFRPIKEKHGDKYTIVDYEPNEDMQELMKFAPLDVAISASVFFWSLGSELLSLTMNYLQNEVTKMTRSLNTQNEVNSENGGAGIQASINALQEISPSLIQSPNYDLLNVSPILPSKSKKRKLKTENLKDK
tara:strand:+ start:1720 stop:2472 length:753 start_codon:yes stop_codon:yes gene_type:complete